MIKCHNHRINAYVCIPKTRRWEVPEYVGKSTCFTRIKPFFTLRDCPAFLKKPLGRRFENTGDNGSVLACTSPNVNLDGDRFIVPRVDGSVCACRFFCRFLSD